MNKSFIRGEQGFTLIEVMIALFVMAFGLLSIAYMQVLGVEGNRFGSKMTLASTLAQDVIERIGQNSTALALYNNIDTNNAATRPAAGEARNDYDQMVNTLTALPNGACTITVNAVGDPVVVGGNYVTVTITWTGKAGALHTVSMPTILSN